MGFSWIILWYRSYVPHYSRIYFTSLSIYHCQIIVKLIVKGAGWKCSRKPAPFYLLLPNPQCCYFYPFITSHPAELIRVFRGYRASISITYAKPYALEPTIYFTINLHSLTVQITPILSIILLELRLIFGLHSSN